MSLSSSSSEASGGAILGGGIDADAFAIVREGDASIGPAFLSIGDAPLDTGAGAFSFATFSGGLAAATSAAGAGLDADDVATSEAGGGFGAG